MRSQHLYWRLVCSCLGSAIARSETQFAVLHPYYKLTYIELVWGGAKEQEAKREAGNWDAKNWQDEAQKVLERTVHLLRPVYLVLTDINSLVPCQMEHYWKARVEPEVPSATPEPPPAASQHDDDSITSEYDRLWHARLLSNNQDKG